METPKVPTLYLETSVPSVFTARKPRDIFGLAHQDATVDFWRHTLPNCKVYVSALVVEEAQKGDPDAAARRLSAIKDFESLDLSPPVIKLAKRYMSELPVPASAEADMTHLALATAYSLDYLVTWNCKHIANGFVLNALRLLNDTLELRTPLVCTPEQLDYEYGTIGR